MIEMRRRGIGRTMRFESSWRIIESKILRISLGNFIGAIVKKTETTY